MPVSEQGRMLDKLWCLVTMEDEKLEQLQIQEELESRLKPFPKI